jgi:phosphoenolpyruvate---glycerone phosphotransferase subunit DhaM
MSRVGLVVVSHSAELAAGVAAVAAQMAPDVAVVPAGGTEDGGIGTDFDTVTAALTRAESGAGVVVLYDLGSARMVAEMAVELAENAVLADAPLVEGTVAAAVAAQGEAGVREVAQAATEAANVTPDAPSPTPSPTDLLITLNNDDGLHARPAALLARAMTAQDAQVTVRFGDRTANGASVLALIALGAGHGDQLHVTATGPQADGALRAVRDLAARNFH